MKSIITMLVICLGVSAAMASKDPAEMGKKPCDRQKINPVTFGANTAFNKITTSKAPEPAKSAKYRNGDRGGA